MKKLLSIIGAASLVCSSSAAVVACGNKKDVIYLIVPEDPNEFWDELIKTAENYVAKDEYKDKYTVRWASSKQDSNNELKNTQSAIDGGARAIIIGQNDPKQVEAAKYAVSNNVPLVAVNMPFADDVSDNAKPNYQVYQDAVAATKEMGETIFKVLKDNGAVDAEASTANVYEIWGDPANSTAIGRHKGFWETKFYSSDWLGNLNDKGLDNGGVNGMYLESTANKLVSDHLQKIIDKKDGADLIFAHSDAMARGALSALSKTDDGKAWLTPTYDGEGNVTKLGGIIIGYDYDASTVTQIGQWANKPAESVFSSVHMSAPELANGAMKNAIAEIENENANKSKFIKEKISVSVKVAKLKKS